jgi:hypothetical protein
MLTVSQLIEILKDKPQDMRVVVDGYEHGCKDLAIPQIRKIRICLNVYAGKSNGFSPHEEVVFSSDPADETALIFSRHA